MNDSGATASSRCILCGESRAVAVHSGSDRLYRTTDEVFTIVRCAGCGLARLDPVPANLAQFYPDRYWHEPDGVAEAYRKLVIRDHLRFALPTSAHGQAQGLRVLDAGCGSGLFLSEVRAADPETVAVGIDASPRAAALAWRRYGVPAIVADLEHAPFAPASFDLIAMFHVLEHLRDPIAYIEAARRLLEPGGRLVVQTPNLDCWQYAVFGIGWSGLDIPRHLYNFRLSDLRRLLERCAFRVTRVKHFSWRDNPAGLATTLAPGLEPVARAMRGDRSRNLLYGMLTAAAMPFAALEAFFGHGSSVMVEAVVTESVA